MVIKQNPKKYSPHIHLDENIRGRDFVVSDLHGYRELLDKALSDVSFSTENDRLIAVGDLIDRGPNSTGCLDLLEEPWFWTVRGNHEQLLIEASFEQTDSAWSRWLMNGGSWVLEEPEIQVKSWAETLQFLPLTITLPCNGKTIGICHAEFTSDDWTAKDLAPPEEQTGWLWGRSRTKNKLTHIVEGVDWVFSGHTIVPEVCVLGNSVFIEKGAYLNNPISLINLQQWVDEH